MNLPKKVATLATSMLLIISLPFSTAYAEESEESELPGKDQFPDPIDPQTWILPRDMTWDDYEPVPGIDWNNTDIEPERELKGALILVDFPDQDFIVTQSEGSDPANNPRAVSDIPREDVPEFWENYLNTPSELNNYQTINGYWRENSYGRWSVDLDSYGPYEMEHNMFQYASSFGKDLELPPEYESHDIKPEAVELAQEDLDASDEEYDFKFIVHAGYDESGVWQEFGEMMFTNKEDITDEFGSPFEDFPNWGNTRFTSWTSWFASKQIWAHAQGDISVQGESDGMSTFAHEFGHAAVDLGDNYNNPVADPVSRSYTGPWEVMSRGHFNGPGGTHTRYHIPNDKGGTVPSHHMLRNKIKQGFVTDDELLRLDRDELAESGPEFADITARAVPIGDKFDRPGLHGINISMVDLTPENSLEDDWRADMQEGEKWYDNYTLEVVDRVGSDSFTPDSGVLIAKTRDEERPSPNTWIIDSHPEDIDMVDFTRPDGTEANFSKGVYQQLSNSLFHAGNGEDVVSEYEDEHNRLHFYILDKDRDEAGVLSYRVAVRNMDSTASFNQGVDVSAETLEPAVAGKVAVHHFEVTNNGEESDIIRLKAETDDGWESTLESDVIEVEPGETEDVSVYVKVPEDKTDPTDLTFTATSETDSDQSATETGVISTDVSASDISSVVERFDQDEETFQDNAAHELELHLEAVSHYEEQEADEKVIKHMKGFKTLLDHHQDKDSISDHAYNTLDDYADALIKVWE